MTLPNVVLPKDVQAACGDLRDHLVSILDQDLLALWVYGAMTFDDPPRKLGDVDTHAVLRSPPRPETVQAIDAIHERVGRDRGVEWDSWYVLARDVAYSTPPTHALRAKLIDDAWALHRAHWLAGRCVTLHGAGRSTWYTLS